MSGPKIALAGISFAALAVQVSLPADPPVVGLDRRVPWTTSRVIGAPEPPLPFVTERAFPALTFKECLDITSAPGSDRLFVVEQSGKIYSFPNRPDVPKADLVVDLAKEIPGVKQVYALAFHPDFERNRYCYVCYIQAPDLPDGTHIARFRVSDTDPPTIDVASEKTIITWLSGGHNGCCLKFGPDGYLYISTGDGVGPNPPDTLKTGQDVSDLLSSILRIDVDNEDDGRNYRIPPDNPFVALSSARGEVWAYGLRNPWRMSFDRKTGDLWVGDVGWELWELLVRVERGGNYGWAVMEGRQPTNPEWPRGPTPILLPTIDHPHSESSSITDGLTYYGRRIPKLHGHHIYGDYDTGKFWGFRYDNGRILDHRELADTTHRIVGFGEDLDGEFYVLDHTAGTIHRLVSNPQSDRSSTFPRTLSQSGLFESVDRHTPAPGVIPYSINAEPWADHAVSERWIAVPGDSSIQTERPAWTFPKDSVLVKTLSLDMRSGEPSSRRRIETQILHFNGIEWMPYTYRWNAEQTDAALVEAGGAEQTLEVIDGTAPGGKRRQTWRFAGRAECQRCHNKWSGPPLAFQAAQLNKDHDYGRVTAAQLDTLAHIQLLAKPSATNKLPRLVSPRDASADLDARARAYLHTNCAHCHRMHAGGTVLSQMQYDLSLAKTNMVAMRPTQGTFGIYGAQVIAPGDPFRSVLLYRLAKSGGGRMPHIGSNETDRAGVALIHDWIRQLESEPVRGEVAEQPVPAAQAREVDAIEQLRASRAGPMQATLVDQLVASTSGALMLLWDLEQQRLPGSAAALAIQRGARHDDPAVRDLFERFLPAEERVRRLGSVLERTQILALPGDAARGRQVYFETPGVACKNCHRIHQDGTEVGPELTTIGARLSREQLLESIIEPSKIIDPKYVTHVAELRDGRIVTGLLLTRTDTEVVLRDAQGKVIRMAVRDLEQFVPQRQSLMPELLFRDMTAEQLADLLAYLGSLK